MKAKRRSKLFSYPTLFAGVLLLAMATIALHAGAPSVAADGDSETGLIEHPKVPFPASLDGRRAEAVYQAIKLQIRNDYARSGDPVALAYQGWKRYNVTPYLSPNHGARFVNHYANDLARAYGKYEDIDRLPVGSVVIKDSFVVTESGMLRTGPFFMMEKMPAGFPSAAGTWRFLMIRPDGEIFGMTGSNNADRVAFCGDCHNKAGADLDYLYFPPDDRRVLQRGAAR